MVRAVVSLLALLPPPGTSQLLRATPQEESSHNGTDVRGLQQLSLARSRVATDEEDLIMPICAFHAAECHAQDLPSRDPLAEAQFLTEREDAAIGFSYGPLPVKVGVATSFPSDDMTSFKFKGQWSREGRNDLGIMHDLGAKMVRLYGKDPALSSLEFLNDANSYNMRVVAGVSGYPYEHSQDDGCNIKTDAGANDFDCYDVLRAWYQEAVTNGTFLIADPNGGERYHPALDTLILLNEPELKYFIRTNRHYMRAFLSALDGILSVEQEHGIDITDATRNIRFTVAFSYGTCQECPSYENLDVVENEDGEKCCCASGSPGCPTSMECNGNPTPATGCPGLAPMMDLWVAVENPESLGYTFRTQNWREAFNNRFVFSVNAFVEAEPFKAAFLGQFVNMPFQKMDDGEPKAEADMFKVMLGEYGNQHVAKNPVQLQSDLEAIVEVANEHPFFIGVNFFQFAVAYWKSCSPTSHLCCRSSGVPHAEACTPETTCDHNEAWEEWRNAFWDQALDAGDNWEEVWRDLAENRGTGPEPWRQEGTWDFAMAAIGNAVEGPPGVCEEREFGLFAFGDVDLSTTIIQDENQLTRKVKCLVPLVPMKVQAVADALGGVAPDMTQCSNSRSDNNFAGIDEWFCIASRGVPAEMITGTMEGITNPPEGADTMFDLAHHNQLMEAIPTVCEEDAFSRGDYFFSSLIEHAKIAPDFFNDGFHAWDLCSFGGAAIWTPVPARRECTFKTYATPPVDEGPPEAPGAPTPSGPTPTPTPTPSDSTPTPSPSGPTPTPAGPAPTPTPPGPTEAPEAEASFVSTPTGMAVIGVGVIAVVGAVGYGGFVMMGGGQAAQAGGANYEMGRRG